MAEQNESKLSFWVVNKFARPTKALQKQTTSVPTLSQGLVRVEVKSIGLNFADVFSVLGLYSASPRPPFVPGLEFAGIVTETAMGGAPGTAPALQVGDRAALQPGDRVMGVTRFGAFTTQIDIDPVYLRKMPADWSFSEGAAFPVQALTAYYGLSYLGGLARPREKRAPNANDTATAATMATTTTVATTPGVLIQSAAGGVGLFALEIAQKSGAHPIAVVGSAVKRDFLIREVGLAPDQIIVRGSPRAFAAELDRVLKASVAPESTGSSRSSVSSQTAGGIDIVMDAVYGRFFWPTWNRLNPMGRYVLFGAADLTPGRGPAGMLRTIVRYLKRPRLDPMKMISQNQSMMGFNLIYLYDRIDLLGPMLDELMALELKKPLVKKTYPFDNLPEALEFFQSGKGTGKVVIETP